MDSIISSRFSINKDVGTGEVVHGDAGSSHITGKMKNVIINQSSLWLMKSQGRNSISSNLLTKNKRKRDRRSKRHEIHFLKGYLIGMKQ